MEIKKNYNSPSFQALTLGKSIKRCNEGLIKLVEQETPDLLEMAKDVDVKVKRYLEWHIFDFSKANFYTEGLKVTASSLKETKTLTSKVKHFFIKPFLPSESNYVFKAYSGYLSRAARGAKKNLKMKVLSRE